MNWPAAALLLCLLLAVPARAQDEAGLRLLIEQLEKTGNYEATLPYYARLLRQVPEDSAVVLGLARALEATGRHEQQVSLLEPWVKGHPGDVQAHLLLGEALHRTGDDERAIKTWLGILDLRPPDPRHYQWVSDRLRAADLHREALRILLDGRKVLGERRLFSWELAELYLYEGNFRRAVEAYLESLDESPQRFPVVESRLVAMARDSSTALALLEALEEAHRRAAEPLPTAQLIATCALETGRPERGLQILEQAGDAELLFQYAYRLEQRGHEELAGRAYGLFAARGEDSPNLYRALLRQADLAFQGGDYERAVDTYTRLVRRYPDRPEALEALFYLGRLQLDVQNDIEGARTSLETVTRAARRGPWTAAALGLLAELALRQGELHEAETRLHELAVFDPASEYQSEYRLAELRFFQGDLRGAVDRLQDLVDQDLANDLANDVLDLLLLCETTPDTTALADFARALLLERQHRPQEAAALWTRLDAQAASALRERALLERARLLERREPGAALALYERLVGEFPAGDHIVAAHLGRARLYEEVDRLEEALKIYETALIQHADDARAPELRLRIQRLRIQLAGRSG